MIARIIVVCLFLGAFLAQADEPLTFTVATVRPTQMTLLEMVQKRIQPIVVSGDFVEINFSSLPMLVSLAYGVPTYRVKVPSRLLQPFYRITAVASRKLTRGELAAPVKALLAERFHLKLHIEQQKTPVYLLMVGPKGLKMSPAAGAKSLKVTNRADGMRQIDYVTTLGEFTNVPLDRPILDRTGLTGVYSGTLTFPIAEMQAVQPPVPGAIMAVGAPNPLFDAVEQLGLRYVASEELLDVYVVDSADENPSVD